MDLNRREFLTGAAAVGTTLIFTTGSADAGEWIPLTYDISDGFVYKRNGVMVCARFKTILVEEPKTLIELHHPRS